MIELQTYCENCTDTMKRMQNGEVDYILTSPPYNIGFDGKNNKKKYLNGTDKMSQIDYWEWQRKTINEMLRVVKHYVIYNIQFNVNNKYALCMLIGSFAGKIKEILIWDKGKGSETNFMPGCFNSIFEFIIIFSKQNEGRQFPYEWIGTKDNIIRRSKNYLKTDVEHSAVMPLYLARELILTFTKPGEIIYDPFAGTGTTLIAAEMEGRRWIGSEVVPAYYEHILTRIKNFQNQTKLFK